MVRPVDLINNVAIVGYPLKLRRYEAGRLPEPGALVDCLIIVNDRSDGVPRARLAYSDGAAWAHIAWVDDVAKVEGKAATTVDVTPLVVQAVRDQLPALVAPAVAGAMPRGLPVPIAAATPSTETKSLARALLEATELVHALEERIVALEERCHWIESKAVARVTVREIA